MAEQPIEFINRYSGELETEAVFGERFLRWTYGTTAGRLTLHGVVKRALFSKMYGAWMSRAGSREQIAPFVQAYGIDASEFAEDMEAFGSFNDFFARRLKRECRPLAEGEDVAIFPADGRHLGFQDLDTADGLYAKGQRWDLPQLLGDAQLASRFARGSAVISRLCPVDYHCFHFPVGGTIVTRARLIRGPLFSVSPIALRRRIGYLWENKRCLTQIESPVFGTVLQLEIGATCVGSIVQSAYAESVATGDIKGWFLFGGSCVITLFEPGRLRLSDDLTRATADGLELYARCGDQLGVATRENIG